MQKKEPKKGGVSSGRRKEKPTHQARAFGFPMRLHAPIATKFTPEENGVSISMCTKPFVVMPNHVHGIILLTDVGAGFKPAPTGTATIHGLSEMIRAFKTFSARRISEQRGTPGLPVWQRNYYEHIIRNDDELNRIREYIANNPVQWTLDRENPGNIGTGFKPAPTEDEPWRT